VPPAAPELTAAAVFRAFVAAVVAAVVALVAAAVAAAAVASADGTYSQKLSPESFCVVT